jgi:hypothetical protein
VKRNPAEASHPDHFVLGARARTHSFFTHANK